MERTTMLRIYGSANYAKRQKCKPLTYLIRRCKRSPVGAPGIEPGTSCTPCKRASRTAPRPVRQGAIIVAIGVSGNEGEGNSGEFSRYNPDDE
jgi:hypothetical protein